MLPRINRLSKQRDFQAVLQARNSHQNELLVIKQKNNDCLFSRFGLIVSAKAARKATVRNRFRRQLTEIIRHRLTRVKPGWDVIIIPKATISNTNYWRLQNSLIDLFKKAKILD